MPAVQETPSSVAPNINSHAEDYVWDLFYRKPLSLSEWNSSAANVGTVWVDLASVSTKVLIFNQRTGLPPSAEDDELSDNSGSEEEDEADEDSNGLCFGLDRGVMLTLGL